MEDQDPPQKKPKQEPKQTWLGNYGFKIIKQDPKNPKNFSVNPVPAGTGHIENSNLKCKGCSKTGFKSIQGLKGHESSCKAFQHTQKTSADTDAAGHLTAIFLQSPGSVKQLGSARMRLAVELDKARAAKATPTTASKAIVTSSAPSELDDGRKKNRGAAIRCRLPIEEKYKHLSHHDAWIHEPGADRSQRNTSQYCQLFHPGEVQKWKVNISKWQSANVVGLIADKLYPSLYKTCRVKKLQSPYSEMEAALYLRIKEHRSKARKVSKKWICLTAKKIMRDLDAKNGTSRAVKFGASNGWFNRFLKRKQIKFRKRKSGKKKSTDDNLQSITNWFTYFRHKVLPNITDDNLSHQFTSKWGRFPPHLRYNMDQVPLPFVVSQDPTYTAHTDSDVHIHGGGKGEGLRKRQFTMHIYMNAGEGEKRDGYVELICRGKVIDGSRFSLAEREAWDPDVKLYFQKNAWMDRPVMERSAERFNNHITSRWGSDAKALLICDNLDAHIADKTKAAFANDNHVFLFCLPPQVTEAIQPIDAGYGRSMRCSIGRLLDDWLMLEDNLRDWEEGMTAAQRRVLITRLVSAANKEVLENDVMRVGCFKRTGCLLTLDGSDDDLI